MHVNNRPKSLPCTKLFATVAATAIATFAVTAQVMADTKIVQSIQIQNPKMQAAMKQQGFGGNIDSTIYVKGSKLRMDNPMISIIQDSATHKMIMLNNRSKTYMTHDMPDQASMMRNMKVKVTDLHQTKSILGHPAHHYKSSVSFGNQNMTADIWAATDMSMPAALATNYSQFGAMNKEFKKISGIPVLITTSMPTPQGQITVTMKVVSISNTNLSASLFQIPAGFMKAPEGAGMGGRMPGMH